MTNVLILGGNGYIGSRLRQVLGERYSVTSNDICWYKHDADSDRKDYQRYTREELAAYDVVVVLAGHSSVKSCAGEIRSPWLNNVTNFTQLLEKLDGQTVIYASSASVYGNGKPGQRHVEKHLNFMPVNNYDITKYVLDQHASLAIQQGKPVIGLRFGTVNGWAPNLRVDVMINAMYDTAKHGLGIKVANRHINRAILGIEDLCRAIESCIERPQAGIYNLASFSLTVGEIAEVVSKKLDIAITDQGNTANAYDFSLNTELFEQTYDFTFTETPASIVDRLVERYEQSHRERRDHFMLYNWEPEKGFGFGKR